MAQIEKSITINASLSNVFDYVTSPDNWTRYVTSLIDVRNMSDEIPKEGTTFDWTYRMLGVNSDGKGKIVSMKKNELFAMEMEGKFPIRETYTFSGDDTSTELVCKINYEVPGKVLGVIANKLVIERLNVKEAVAVLNKVKDLCEAHHS